MATTPDTRSTSSPGESRNGHFTDAVSKVDEQRAIMSRVFRSRVSDQSGLTFPEPPGDD
jgi:hypothetical protein